MIRAAQRECLEETSFLLHSKIGFIAETYFNARVFDKKNYSCCNKGYENQQKRRRIDTLDVTGVTQPD